MKVYLKTIIVISALVVTVWAKYNQDEGYIAACATPSYMLEIYRNGTATAYACPTETPFCSQRAKKCVSYKPVLNSAQCLQANGYLPALRSTSEFYICINGTASKIVCKDKEHYDYETNSCTFHSPIRINCDGKAFMKVPIVRSSYRLFAYCGVDGPIKLGQCDPGQWFSEDRQECLTFCPGIGHIPHPTDPTRYEVCTETARGYVGETRYCELGYFDPGLSKCKN